MTGTNVDLIQKYICNNKRYLRCTGIRPDVPQSLQIMKTQLSQLPETTAGYTSDSDKISTPGGAHVHAIQENNTSIAAVPTTFLVNPVA